MIFARVAVNVPSLNGIFDYHLPEELEGLVSAGHLVTVPFGRQSVQGVVMELTSSPAVAETRAIASLLDPLPALTPMQLALARWMAQETLAPLSACIGLMLPGGLEQQADTLYELVCDRVMEEPPGKKSPIQQRLFELLKDRGPLRGRQIDRHFKNVDWRKAVPTLLRAGALSSRPVLPPPTVRPKVVRTAQLVVPPLEALAAMPGLGRTSSSLARRQAALQFLMDEPAPVDVSWLYASSGCSLADLQELAERELITLQETEAWRDPLRQIKPTESENNVIPELTPDQETAWQQILAGFNGSVNAHREFLLHGVTGSGKTELYLRATRECLLRGRQAVILVPEIALTPQTVHRFLARFPGEVGLVHSRLSEGERYDTWRRARLGKIQVVIGPRSALFSPLPDIGLVVLDECHDGSYYQAEPPFYSAVETARHAAHLSGAVCILGSATPTVSQRYQASTSINGPGRIMHLLELPKRIVNPEMPPVRIVDMREELKAGNRGIFSRELVNCLAEVLNKGQQAILFLNRRGTATYVFCRDCGTSLRCPRCDTPLTYHSVNLQSNSTMAGDLRCHHCGYTRNMPGSCPNCGSRHIRQYGLGSEKVEAEVAALFPSARILRWDWETTRRKESHEIILSHFTSHRADVLVGTQMLAKGLDLPLVTLVGIVMADMGLNLPDPFAPERTFNILTQVAGRAGRSSLGGRVVLQTFQPDHYVIQAASRHDYASFYDREMGNRRDLGYPPFYRLLRLEYRHISSQQAEEESRRQAEKLIGMLEEMNRRETTLIGPAPCFYPRLGGMYRWQIILRGPDPAGMLRDGFGSEPSLGALKGWRLEVDPVSFL